MKTVAETEVTVRERVRGRTFENRSTNLIRQDSKSGVFLMREDTDYRQGLKKVTETRFLVSDIREIDKSTPFDRLKDARRDFRRRQRELSNKTS